MTQFTQFREFAGRPWGTGSPAKAIVIGDRTAICVRPDGGHAGYPSLQALIEQETAYEWCVDTPLHPTPESLWVLLAQLKDRETPDYAWLALFALRTLCAQLGACLDEELVRLEDQGHGPRDDTDADLMMSGAKQDAMRLYNEFCAEFCLGEKGQKV